MNAYAHKFNNGYEFERYVFGKPVLNEFACSKESANNFSNAIRRAIVSANGRPHPETEVGRDLYFFVSQFLAAAKLPIQKFGLYSAIKTDADYKHGVDGLFYFSSEDKEALALIDAFLTPEVLIKNLQERELGPFSAIQDELYRMKKIIRNVKQSNPQNELIWKKFWPIFNSKEPTKEFARPKNCFVITPFDLHRPKGMKELGKGIAKSLIYQIKPGIKLPF